MISLHHITKLRQSFCYIYNKKKRTLVIFTISKFAVIYQYFYGLIQFQAHYHEKSQLKFFV